MTDTVLVTGSSSGIGRATARRFAEAGWTVYATARDPDDVSGLAARGCHTPALDVTDDAAVSRVVAAATEDDDGLDCLVNAAGFGQYGPLEDVTVDRLVSQFDINVYGPHRLCRAALPSLREAGGTVVTVSSLAAHAPFPGAGAYCASKAAVEAHHDALRAELAADTDVDVVLVQPGPVETGFRARRERELDALAQSAAYAGVYDRHRGETTRGALFVGVTADDVAESVFVAATATHSPARLPVGRRVRLAVAFARVLPAAWHDRVYGWL